MIGETLDHYRIVERIGAGGMGVVYRAVDERLQRDVAVKVLPPGALRDEPSRKRFHREALTLSKLNHPHIATVYDFHTQDDTDFLVMEYVAGATLSAMIDGGPLSEQDVARLGRHIAEALSEAHEQGVVHRDLKPGNVVVTKKHQAKVLDFGLAKLLEPLGEDAPTVEKTQAGIARGTLPYMSPEQLLGEPVSPRSDVYAAGALLYEMATGQRAFPEVQGPRLIESILHKTPTPPSSLNPEISRDLERIILKALEREPSRRYQTADELAEDLERISLSASLPAARRSSRRFLRPTHLLLAAGLLSGAVLALRWSGFVPTLVPGGGESQSTESPVVAILPFANLTGDPSIDYVGVGIAHSLVTSLSALPALTLVSVSASAPLASRDGANAHQVMSDLGATYVVTGSVQRAGERLLLTANLLRSDNSVAWGGESEGTLEDLFSLQRQLAEGLGRALHPALTEAERRGLETPPTKIPAAFGDYTQARTFLDRRDVPGNLDLSIQLYESAIQKDPKFALARAGLGEAFWAKYELTGDSVWTERARAATMEALRLDPDRARVRTSLAIILKGTGRDDEALEEISRALALQPNQDDAHRLKGEILASRGRLAEAVTEFEEAIAIRPNYWGNLRALSMAYYRAGEYEEAAGVAERVTELQPDAATGFQALGAIYHTMGDVNRAVRNYERAIELGPSAGSYSNLGTLHYRQGNFLEAARDYQKAIELGPGSSLRHRNLGDAYRRLGRLDDARDEYRRAKELAEGRLRVNPSDASVVAALGLYEAKLGEGAEAARHAAAAVELAPTDPDVLYRRAVVHALAGELDESLVYLDRALERGYSASEVGEDDDLDALRRLPGYRAVMERHE